MAVHQAETNAVSDRDRDVPRPDFRVPRIREARAHRGAVPRILATAEKTGKISRLCRLKRPGTSG